ncbi:thioredoxin family protein [Nioella nitratireducens]|uniref:thioredoxin family protein n=1 Tax=Nioella nitratireducens TaxID=1287720 RepID=UPI0008FD6AF6|nr:thioredoxin family protein [Nioella nitratireducens]
MNRRDVMMLAGAAMLAAGTASADTLQYTPGLVTERLAAGETVFPDFFAPWCSTCRAQERHIDALRAETPGYDASMTFIRVDWDSYGQSALAQSLQIPRRSTLVVLRGDQELGRLVAGTRRADIQALLDLGLS